MNRTHPIYSLCLDYLREMPNALDLNKELVMVNNVDTPHITALTSDWKQVPAQLDSIFTIFCTQGKIRVRIALEEYELTENTVCIMIPGTIVEILSVSHDFHCLTLAFSSTYINLSQSKTLEILKLLKYLQRKPCYCLSGNYATRYRETFLEAWKTIEWKENPLRNNMMQGYIYLLFCCLYPVLEQEEKENACCSSQRELYFRFIELLQANYRKERTVAFYAQKLKITPKYLSKVVCAESGQTALKWIDNFVILEAKALLKQHDMNVQTVSERLNFPDQSTFGKFFRRVTGVTPKAYREN